MVAKYADHLPLTRQEKIYARHGVDLARSTLCDMVEQTADALRYLDDQWLDLCRFLEDGRLKIDNNGAERQQRAIAVGRKNWLFSGSTAGAHRAAPLYSLVQSCRPIDIDPFVYFRDVLLRVATHPQSRISELTPAGWIKSIAP